MTRFFFDITENGMFVRDDEGLELPSIDAARQEARATIGGIAREVLCTSTHGELTISARDQTGQTIATVKMTYEVDA
jgi:hypothetical protein